MTGQDTRSVMIQKIADAQKLLVEARTVAMQANTLAVQVPAIQRLEKMGKECSEVMRDVSRMIL